MTEQIHTDRVLGARLLLSSVVVPALSAQARNQGLSLYAGITRAIEENVSWRDVVSHPGFQNFMNGPLGAVVRTLAESMGDLADLKPGETVEQGAQWLLEQTAQMEFETSGGVVPGWQVYAAIANQGAKGKQWFTDLIRDLHLWVNGGM